MALSLAAASLTSHASDINIGGVVFDPDYLDVPHGESDMQMSLNFTQWFVTGADIGTYNPSAEINPATVIFGDELQGSGIVTKLNEYSNGLGLCPGCELTFEFGGLLADGAGGFQTGGFFNFYVETGADIDGFYTEDANPVIWLTLDVDNVVFTSFGGSSGPYAAGFISVDLSAIGGLAMDNFDTNTLNNEMSDVFYSATAIFGANNKANGGGIAVGDTIPEPTTVAIFGLALMGLAAGRYRKNV